MLSNIQLLKEALSDFPYFNIDAKNNLSIGNDAVDDGDIGEYNDEPSPFQFFKLIANLGVAFVFLRKSISVTTSLGQGSFINQVNESAEPSPAPMIGSLELSITVTSISVLYLYIIAAVTQPAVPPPTITTFIFYSGILFPTI